MHNRSAVLSSARHLDVLDQPVPTPGARQVLVEVHAVGICGSDVHYYEHGRIGPYVVDHPMVIGHEAAGTIVATGEAVHHRSVGERVALEPGVPCRSCSQCLSGRYNLCPDVVFFATPPVDGAISQLVAIDADFAHPVPAGLGYEQAAMAEPVSVGVWAARRAAITPGDRVLVTGAGPIGLLAAQVARSFGGVDVTVTDLSDYRLSVARGLGLTAHRADQALDHEYDVLIECSGAQPALTTGMAATARAGRVVLVGMGTDTVQIDVPLLQGREITLTGTFRYANTYPLALNLIATGQVRVDEIITHRFTIDQTEDALTIGRNDPNALKAIVLPQT
jgi:L-iditol 2-dehydrogenase